MTGPVNSGRKPTWDQDYDPRSGYQTDVTVRDLVWNATLELLQERLMFRQWMVRERAGLRDSHSRTVRRTLKSMAEFGWIERPDGRPNYWMPGEKAEERLDGVRRIPQGGSGGEPTDD